MKVDQEFLVKTDTTPNNTDEDIMGETGENTVPLSGLLLRIIPHTTKDFRLAARSHKKNGVFRRICNLMFKSSPIVLFQMLNLRTTNTTPFQAMSYLLLVLMSS